MSHPAVEWTLDRIKANWSAGAWDDVPLERIDRDESEILAGDVRSHSAELQDANYVGVSLADRTASPIGTEFDHDVQTVVSVRIEGAHVSEFGYVDGDASLPPATAGDPVAWNPLAEEVRATLLRERTFPDAGGADVSFTHLEIANEADQSSDYADYYRRTFDVLFDGFETLP